MLEDTSITEKELSPRIAVNYHIIPGHTIRASYSEATRNPVLVEEKSEWRICALGVDPTCTIPNTYMVVSRASGGLIPEQISTRDISYMAQVTNSLYFDIRLSRSDIEHLIDWIEITVTDNFDPNADVLDYVTRDVTDSLDTAELQVSYSPGENDRLLLSFAHLDIESGLDTEKRNYTPSVPKKVGSLLMMHNFQDGFKGSIGYYFLDELKHLDSSGLITFKMEERKQLDIRLSKQFSIGGSEAEFSGVIQNILDDYIEYNGNNLVSTRYYLSFGLKFN
jgi:iron complex outermembrane receptor protein